LQEGEWLDRRGTSTGLLVSWLLWHRKDRTGKTNIQVQYRHHTVRTKRIKPFYLETAGNYYADVWEEGRCLPFAPPPFHCRLKFKCLVTTSPLILLLVHSFFTHMFIVKKIILGIVKKIILGLL
jgi:hypothetical protein